MAGKNTQKKELKTEEMEEAHPAEEKYLYVYGIINKEAFITKDINNHTKTLCPSNIVAANHCSNINVRHYNSEIRGLKDKPIKKLDFEDLAVLVSDYPVLHPDVEEKEVMFHAEILNKLAQKITIIPMAFGTVFKDQEILENVLASSHQTAKAALKLIAGKIELGLKVIKKDVDESEGLAKEILEPLSSSAVKTIQGDKFSDRLLLNNSFLVEKKKFSEFSEKVGVLEEKHPELKFSYTGPWPPYSFVNIKIQGGG